MKPQNLLTYVLGLLFILACSTQSPFEAPRPAPAKWTSEQLNLEVNLCVQGALYGQTNYPELERQARAYCLCVFQLVAERYTYDHYNLESDYILSQMNQEGKFSVCH